MNWAYGASGPIRPKPNRIPPQTTLLPPPPPPSTSKTRSPHQNTSVCVLKIKGWKCEFAALFCSCQSLPPSSSSQRCVAVPHPFVVVAVAAGDSLARARGPIACFFVLFSICLPSYRSTRSRCWLDRWFRQAESGGSVFFVDSSNRQYLRHRSPDDASEVIQS